MKLRCISRYENRAVAFNPGDEFEPGEKLYAFLMADSPGSFEELPDAPAQSDIETPEGTKVVRKKAK